MILSHSEGQITFEVFISGVMGITEVLKDDQLWVFLMLLSESDRRYGQFEDVIYVK